mmetsp:Transcript_27667/g.51915  ORF Transcript_27667/g.51915 Transcript_27667/m.51915 type:complete len:410 (-) Transcript_27667:30-1259(-)
MGKEKEQWDLLEKLPVKELRRQAARKCVPLTLISTAVEKSDLINLIIKAGPVLDQYDVNVGVKVWTAEAIESHQPGTKPVRKDKDKKSDKNREKDKAKEAKEVPDKGKKKKKKKGSSGSEEASENKKKKKRSKSRHKKGKKGTSRSPSLTMMLPAPPEVSAKKARRSPSLTIVVPGEAAKRKAVPRKASRSPSLTMMIADDDDVVVQEKPARVVQEKPAKVVQEKTAKVNAEAAMQALLPPAKAAAAPQKALPTPHPATAVDVPSRKPPGADTAQAGVAAAAALGFDVLPKQSSYTSNAPAPGLRPSLNAPSAPPVAGSNSLGQRVCVQYLCFTRCDRGSNCPEAHIMDPEEEMRVRAKFKLQECNQGASCTRTSCLFRHPGERVEEATLSGNQVLQKATPQAGPVARF